ncbi:MAG: cation transporter [Magnetococcales bacterium]|nr:cation transporter [Magnetococcales bacterium]MBF0148721.1 cation transporter [Magnetococcales bacterium]MBF0173257.1 cation transporter [Magnetococcales bacterium]MBF0348503.1 cation transporter [Magnetococcales bacterium]MBF0630270.1 cation transporter [Magnetococcales bacterium]
MRRKPECVDCVFKAAKLDLAVVAGQALFTGAIGFLTGSVALHAFALQFVGDLLAKSVSFIGIRASIRPPTEDFPYGYGKIQFLTALFVGLALLLGAVSFMAFNVIHLHEGMVSAPSGLAIPGTLLTAAVCELMYRYMSCVGRENNNLVITAAAWDNRNDALSALAILVGVVASKLGATWADHLAALAVSLLVIRAGLVIVTDAVKGLLDVTAPEHVLHEVEEVVGMVPEIRDRIDFRSRRLGDTWELDLRLGVDEGLSVTRLHQLEIELIHQIYQHVPHTGHVHVSFVPCPRDQTGPDDA